MIARQMIDVRVIMIVGVAGTMLAGTFAMRCITQRVHMHMRQAAQRDRQQIHGRSEQCRRAFELLVSHVRIPTIAAQYRAKNRQIE